MSDLHAQWLQEQLLKQLRLSRDAISVRTLLALIALLERASVDRLPSAIAEALIALRLMHGGFSVLADVPTPNGKTCDFRATRGEFTFYVHVKRLRTNATAAQKIPATIRRFIRCRRKVSAEVWWRPDLNAAALARLGHSFNAFLREAAIGESLSVRDAPNIEIGRVKIHSPTLTKMQLRHERNDRTRTLDRCERLILRAFEQCMPRAVNVIAVVSDHASDWEFIDVALRGQYVERWDQFPNRGERRAYGRADDGLWSQHRAPWCKMAVALALDNARDAIHLSSGVLMQREIAATADTATQLIKRGLIRARS